MNTRKIIALLLCFILVMIPFNILHDSISKIESQIEELNYEIEVQSKEIQQLNYQTQHWQSEISNLYEMNRSHANCVAMAVLMNKDSVLAGQYGRTEEEQIALYGNDTSFVDFYGRLYVPDAKIDVALYLGYAQGICDRQDSANFFSFGLDEGKTIADHNNQEFSKLFSVEVGTLGYIELENGDIINIVCTDVFNGHHDGTYIVDENWVNIMNVADYMMYTCRDSWRNVRICLWERY